MSTVSAFLAAVVRAGKPIIGLRAGRDALPERGSGLRPEHRLRQPQPERVVAEALAMTVKLAGTPAEESGG